MDHNLDDSLNLESAMGSVSRFGYLSLVYFINFIPKLYHSNNMSAYIQLCNLFILRGII